MCVCLSVCVSVCVSVRLSPTLQVAGVCVTQPNGLTHRSSVYVNRKRNWRFAEHLRPSQVSELQFCIAPSNGPKMNTK